MSKRVVVTGLGAVTPLGNDVTTFWEHIKQGQHGIAPITKIDTTDLKIKLAAEVKDFDAERYIAKKEARRMDLFCQYAMDAAAQAIADAKLNDEQLRGNSRIGVMVGSGVGGLQTMEENVIRMHEKGLDKIKPLYIPMIIVNMAAGQIAIRYGMQGICSSVVTACSTSANCIGDAFRHIKHGYADAMIVGGAEATICNMGVGGFMTLTALSASEDPDRASIPFDRDRNGFVMGEGAGILVLETLEHAQSRGAKIYGEVVGYGATGDAYHMTAPDPEGKGAALAMTQALEEGGVAKTEVTYINAHGTGTQANDLPETIAIKKAFGEQAYKIPVSSTKSMTGHLLGAAGAIETIVCLCALQEDFVPPTAGLLHPDEGCDLDYVPKVGRSHEMKYAVTNSMGFGGHNVSLCLKKWED